MISNKELLICFLDQINVENDIIRDKLRQITPLLYFVNFDVVQIYIEDVEDEVYVCFSLLNPDFENSGELMFSLREEDTKIYIYRKKILFENDSNKLFSDTLDFIEKLLRGKYCLIKKYRNKEVFDYEVFFDVDLIFNGVNMLR